MAPQNRSKSHPNYQLTLKRPAALNEETLPVTSLYEALQDLPDPRRAQGKRYELALILCFLVLAK
jgi:hypothetical protein